MGWPPFAFVEDRQISTYKNLVLKTLDNPLGVWDNHRAVEMRQSLDRRIEALLSRIAQMRHGKVAPPGSDCFPLSVSGASTNGMFCPLCVDPRIPYGSVAIRCQRLSGSSSHRKTPERNP